MRRFLLIFACALSFCVRAETNVVVELTQEQYSGILSMVNFLKSLNAIELRQMSDGRLSFVSHVGSSFSQTMSYLTGNQVDILQYLHLLFTGSVSGGYNVGKENILAYASSLRQHNQDMLEVIADNLEPEVNGIWGDLGRYHLANTALFNAFRGDYSNGVDRLYEAITNLDFNVSISNQTAILQSVDGMATDLSAISNLLAEISDEIVDWRLVHEQNLAFRFQRLNDTLNGNHEDLMDFLHSLSNSTLFASNVFANCGIDTNYTDSIVAMLQWMTNNWHFSVELNPADTNDWQGGSNDVWNVWIPSDETWPDLAIPALTWERNDNQLGFYPRYLGPDEQYDGNFKSIARQYYNLLQNFEAGDIDGQKFFTGLVDLQLHIMANMSTQLYMIDLKLPTKTNLWDWIEQYKTEVQERVQEAQSENANAVSAATALLDYTPFSSVGGHFPKVSATLEKLRVDSGAPTVVRLPIPAALRHSDSDELVVDLGEKEWYSTGKAWCRWIFTFIWGWLFIRLGIVPIFYIFFFGLRVAEISAHMVFFGSVRGSSGIASSVGASAVDMVLSLLGIDTDFKRFVWGIMRD